MGASSRCPATTDSYKSKEQNKHRADEPQDNCVPIVHCLRFPWTQKHKTTVSTWASHSRRCCSCPEDNLCVLPEARSKDFCKENPVSGRASSQASGGREGHGSAHKILFSVAFDEASRLVEALAPPVKFKVKVVHPQTQTLMKGEILSSVTEMG